MPEFTILNYKIDPIWLSALIFCLILPGFQTFSIPVFLLMLVFGIEKTEK
ncbi:hypothetical protein ACWEWU_11135 [Staphylococcus xylosus]